ncbi:hypothetical protein RyT2_17350 [Pseudolactococcus yaeyamensis]
MAEKNNGFLNRIISRFTRNVSETELALNEQLTNFRVTFERVLDVEEYQHIEKELEPIKERLLNSPHSLDVDIVEEYYLGTFIHDSQYRDMNFVEYSDNRPQILEEHAEWVEVQEQFAEAEEKALVDYDEKQERALENQEYTEIAQIEADMVSQKRADKLSERLPNGWKMFMYGDGSGHFTAPSGAEFARFDNYTKDFKLLNSQERYGFVENPSEFLSKLIIDNFMLTFNDSMSRVEGQINDIDLSKIEYYAPSSITDVFDLSKLTDRELAAVTFNLIDQTKDTFREISDMAENDPDLHYWQDDYKNEVGEYENLAVELNKRHIVAPRELDMFNAPDRTNQLVDNLLGHFVAGKAIEKSNPDLSMDKADDFQLTM